MLGKNTTTGEENQVEKANGENEEELTNSLEDDVY